MAPYERVNLRTYCKPNLTASLLMRNSTAPRRQEDQETNVVYQFTCPDDACQRRKTTYIGLTTTTLKRRMQGHRNSGAIHDHYTETHDRKPQVAELLNNTKIINRESTKSRLRIAEAVSIELQRPNLNIQTQFDLVLPSSRRRVPPQQPAEVQPATAAQPTATIPDDDVTPSLENGTRGGGRRQLRNLPPRNYRE